MAEMTAREAIENLRRRDEDEPRLAVAMYAHVADQIAALIQQQAATIEAQAREIERLTNVYNAASRYIADGLFNVDFNYGQLEKALEIAKWQVKEGQ